ncbi:hypothetical protein EMPS_10043 [Entomortierella parvispora]|uniref:NADP-dependent oxidoreductase domain-containing protein n=1 Tax=Entomortierella parvispora TaxID=205924 RepID=A0A9P3HJ61_9FUNG|nr:hypothetical protein EMPS_10043 [Entomortierella parvispora]
MCNPIARAVVPELLPCLEHLNISFYAYNPIAGGLLSGKYRFDEVAEGSRYDPKTAYGSLFRGHYWNDPKASQVNKIPLLEATLRWMKHHSGLAAKDGIILGASSLQHLEENLKNKGPLRQSMIDAFDEDWETVKPVSSTYFRTPDTRFRVKEDA